MDFRYLVERCWSPTVTETYGLDVPVNWRGWSSLASTASMRSVLPSMMPKELVRSVPLASACFFSASSYFVFSVLMVETFSLMTLRKRSSIWKHLRIY